MSQNSKQFVPPGHFYSPIPSLDEVEKKSAQLFGDNPPLNLAGVDINQNEQLAYFEKFVKFYKEFKFPNQRTEGFRYYAENDFFSYGDAITYYSMLRLLKPRKIIEIGSGFSSALALDVAEIFLDNEVSFTFIEPYPDILYERIKEEDKKAVQIIVDPVQDVPKGIFDQLNAGDILFIDSTHVSKIGSDVNHIYFEILPHIKPGVFIHVHDIFYPFEYPKQWIMEGRSWNEAYMLRAFLQFNSEFKVIFFNNYFYKFHEKKLEQTMPLYLKNPGGSIWLQRKKLGTY